MGSFTLHRRCGSYIHNLFHWSHVRTYFSGLFTCVVSYSKTTKYSVSSADTSLLSSDDDDDNDAWPSSACNEFDFVKSFDFTKKALGNNTELFNQDIVEVLGSGGFDREDKTYSACWFAIKLLDGLWYTKFSHRFHSPWHNVLSYLHQDQLNGCDDSMVNIDIISKRLTDQGVSPEEAVHEVLDDKFPVHLF
ncbi:hypothetical protein M426DRAFT_317114 [Hypoxylon sp. CI-4A]|nr:hypothetical protein M426DRAFT_317114 [Hypoxylon sp. CI-4A]